jgi:hypothetical protein
LGAKADIVLNVKRCGMRKRFGMGKKRLYNCQHTITEIDRSVLGRNTFTLSTPQFALSIPDVMKTLAGVSSGPTLLPPTSLQYAVNFRGRVK